jgi:Rnl2 family RNA ligase
VDHRPYPKIARELTQAPLGEAHWVATEKIHGAQFVVATNGDEIAFGKRKAWLSSDEPFFGWQALRSELDVSVRALFELLGRGGTLYVYGELFGGQHPSAPPLPGMSAVQTGIWYSPSLHFFAFDLLLVDGEDERFLAHRELEHVAADAGLHVAPILGRGSRGELMRLPVRFETRVPELLGVEPLANNFAEGLVLKPDLEIEATRRPIVKRKIPEFDELVFDESRPFDSTIHLSLDELMQWAERMVNPSRIASARSKVGEEIQAIVDEAMLDVWIDLESMFPRRMRALDDEDESQLRSGLLALVTDQA